MKDGDQATEYFSNIIRVKHKRELIEGIQVSGEILEDPSSIREAFYNFYKDLFTSEYNDFNKATLDNCLKLITEKISDSEGQAYLT